MGCVGGGGQHKARLMSIHQEAIGSSPWLNVLATQTSHAACLRHVKKAPFHECNTAHFACTAAVHAQQCCPTLCLHAGQTPAKPAAPER